MDKDKIAIILRKRRGVLLIIIAALLLELLSGAQYYLTRHLMEGDLEKRAESELTLKAILIKSNLNDAEDNLKNHMWKIQAHLDRPDSAFITMKRVVGISHNLQGAGVGFVPDYYPQKGRLFEVYARRKADGEVEVSQIGGPGHDYTRRDFYQRAIQAGHGIWSEPYYDAEGAQDFITTFSLPVLDRKSQVVGVAIADMSLKWLADTIGKRYIYPSSAILLLSEHNLPIIKPSSGRISEQTMDYFFKLITDSTVAHQKSSSGRSTLVHFRADNRDGSIFYAFMKGTPHWKIAVVCYDDEVYASLSNLRIWFMLLMLLAFGILLYVVSRFARGEEKIATTSQLLHEKMLEQERISGELRIANDIQQALLPIDDPALIALDEVQVEGRLIPAKAVGGDLYNVFVRDEKLFFCIGDVSGKGVPAALIMAVTQTLFHSFALHESNPAHIMDRINEAACRNNKSNMFATMFVGVLDLPTGLLRYCNAGHDLPILIGDELLVIDAPPNLPVGLFSDFTYEMLERRMAPGWTLFLYTDGLTEARSARHELFGRERVMQMIAGCTGMAPKQMVEAVIEQVGQFADDTEQSDDLTLLAIRYAPKIEQIVCDEELTLTNDVQEVATLSAFIKDLMNRLNIGRPLGQKLRLALEEAVVNVMEYAYSAGKKGEVIVRVTFDGVRLRFIITDRGVSFDPTKNLLADTTLSVEERPIGGLGILLIRQLMDSINYERIGGCNVLTLTKNVRKHNII